MLGFRDMTGGRIGPRPESNLSERARNRVYHLHPAQLSKITRKDYAFSRAQPLKIPPSSRFQESQQTDHVQRIPFISTAGRAVGGLARPQTWHRRCPRQISKTKHRSDKRQTALDRSVKDLQLLHKHFRVRSILRSPEVIKNNMSWKL